MKRKSCFAFLMVLLSVLPTEPGLTGTNTIGPAGSTGKVFVHIGVWDGIWRSDKRDIVAWAGGDHVRDRAALKVNYWPRISEYERLTSCMEQEVQLMLKAGIDGGFVDVFPRRLAEGDKEMTSRSGFELPMPFGEGYPRSSQYLVFSAYLAAAKKLHTNIQFAIQIDDAYKQNEEAITAQIARALKDYQNHPNYLKVDTKPVVATWLPGGKRSPSPDRWIRIKETLKKRYGLDVFFVHHVTSFELSKDPRWLDTSDGLYQFMVNADDRNVIKEQGKLILYFRKRSKVTTFSISPGYWQPGRNFGFPEKDNAENKVPMKPERLSFWDEQWRAARQAGADWVVINTWNDFSEDTHVMPSLKKETTYLTLLSYYGSIFKRQPRKAVAETVIVNYPEQVNNPKVIRNTSPDDPDIVQVWSYLKSSAEIEITPSREKKLLSPGKNIVSFQKLPPGVYTFSLLRSGKKILAFPVKMSGWTSGTPINFYRVSVVKEL